MSAEGTRACCLCGCPVITELWVLGTLTRKGEDHIQTKCFLLRWNFNENIVKLTKIPINIKYIPNTHFKYKLVVIKHKFPTSRWRNRSGPDLVTVDYCKIHWKFTQMKVILKAFHMKEWLYPLVPVKRFQSPIPTPSRPRVRPGGWLKSEISVFNHPPPGILSLISITPLLWWLTRLRFSQWSLTVKVDKTYRCCHHFYSQWCNFYSWWWNLQVLSCVYLCKFHHQL